MERINLNEFLGKSGMTCEEFARFSRLRLIPTSYTGNAMGEGVRKIKEEYEQLLFKLVDHRRDLWKMDYVCDEVEKFF
jgi:hypothetical protein